MSLYDRIIGKLFDGIHRIISADVDKYFDLRFIHNGKDLFIDFGIFMDLRQLKTAGT